MAKIQNVSGDDRTVPSLGGRLVLADQIVEVPDDAVYGFTQQTDVWAPAGEGAQEAHDAGHAAYLERRSAELGGVEVDDNGAPIPPAPLVEPAGNAKRDEWADYVVRAGLADEETAAGLNRDELRALVPDDDTDQTGDQAPGDDTSTDGSN